MVGNLRSAASTWAGSRRAGLVVAAITGVAVTLGAQAATAQEAPSRAALPAPDTIVAVSGDAENGFSIRRFDGSTQHPPTTSESHAECEEYDSEVDVAVCKAEVDTWYRDLGELQKALRWANRPRPGGGTN